jgi:hypothetical protein
MKELILKCFINRVTEIEYFSDGFIVQCGRFLFTFMIGKTEFIGVCYDLIQNKSANCNTIEIVKDCLDDLDTINHIYNKTSYDNIFS